MIVRIIERMGLLNTVDILTETETLMKGGGLRKSDGSGFYGTFDTFIVIACMHGNFTIEDIAGSLSDSDEDEYYDEPEETEIITEVPKPVPTIAPAATKPDLPPPEPKPVEIKPADTTPVEIQPEEIKPVEPVSAGEIKIIEEEVVVP